jgi:cytochrome c oxidase cbb3-type subunit I
MSQVPSNNSEQDAVKRALIDRSLRHPVMFFFTSGAAWLAVSILLGIIASAKIHAPTFLSCSGFLTIGRVQAAHTNALIYGWCFQAAFGALIWLVARLTRQECRNAGTILTAGHIWNLIVAAGVIGILGGKSTGMTWMEMPTFTWFPLLITYTLIVVWSMVQFRVRGEGHVFISLWYVLAALIWFPWVFGASHIIIHYLNPNPVMAAAINAWFHSGLTLLFFIPIAIALAYYLVSKVTGRPIHNYSLSVMGFWTLAIVGPWAGLQKLAGAPIPYFLPYLSAAAAATFAIPAVSTCVNLLSTAASAPEVVAKSPTLRFTLAGVISLGLLGVISAFLNIPSILQVTQFTSVSYGFDIVALYACFSFIAFGAIYFIVPRITQREWLSSRLIKMHFFFSVYGIVAVTLGGIFGGYMQGLGQQDIGIPWESAAMRAYPYAVSTTLAWCFILFSNVFFFLHLALMWLRLGRRSSHPTLLDAEHHDDSMHDAAHGAEGDVDNAGPAHAH